MKIPVTAPNDCGVYVEAVHIYIPVKSGYGFALGFAKNSKGVYHISYHWATPTGCSICGVSAKNGSFGSHEDAFIGGLNRIRDRFKLIGLENCITEAKREFFKYHHKQLSLFD